MLSDSDIAKIRNETPGCGMVTHFNHSSCSLPPSIVIDTIVGHLRREAMFGPSEVGAQVMGDVQKTRDSAAALLNCTAEEIALVGSGSHGWGIAFAALPPLGKGDRVLVGRQEWGGNLAMLHHAATRAGATVESIPCAPDGTVSVGALKSMIDDRVRLVAITWLPATNGLINPVAAIGKVTRAAGIPYFVDAGQALGQIPADVREIGCDVLKGAGRKFLRGPRGTALLYVRRAFLDRLNPAYLDVSSAPWGQNGPVIRSDARRFETAENAFALQLGLGEAIRYTMAIGVPVIRERIRVLAEYLRGELAAIPGLTVQDGGGERSGIVSFTMANRSPQDIRVQLASQKINIGSIGAAYTPLDMKARGLPEIARASVSYFTTEAEIGCLIGALKALD